MEAVSRGHDRHANRVTVGHCGHAEAERAGAFAASSMAAIATTLLLVAQSQKYAAESRVCVGGMLELRQSTT